MTNYQAGQVVQVTAGTWLTAAGASPGQTTDRWCSSGMRCRARRFSPGVTEVTSRLARAEAVEILTPSPDRVEPPCPHAGPGGCGGCDWQHATLPAQRSLKAAVIRQQLRRLAGLDREVTVEALPGDEEPGRARPGLGWRTRVQFAVRPDGVAGLRAHRSHEVIDIGECLIAHPAITDLGLPARRWPADGLGGGPGGDRIGRTSRDHHPGAPSPAPLAGKAGRPVPPGGRGRAAVRSQSRGLPRIPCCAGPVTA